MAATFTAGNVLAFADDKNGVSAATGVYDTVAFKDVTGKMDLTGVALENFNSSVLENENATSAEYASGTHTFIVGLDADCLLDGAPAGLPVSEYIATSEGGRAVKSIERSQREFFNELKNKGIGYKYVNSYSTVANAVAISTDAANLSKIKTINSVKSVVYSSTYAYPQAVKAEQGDTINPSNVYATGIYNSEKYVEEGIEGIGKIDGSGMSVAILDTGLDYTHPAFSHDPETVSLTKENVRTLLASKEFSAEKSGATVDELYVSAKVPFAYDYADKDADVYPSYSQHGTHVAGIVAGKDESYTDKDGNVAKDEQGNPLTFRGAAPEAQLVICKVFTDDFESDDIGGAVTEDILAALEDCTNLGVDIINMSLGTSAGFSSIEIDGDTEGAWMNEVYGKIKDKGINLICAASNDYSSGFGSAFGTNRKDNPDSGTVGSPSTFTGALSVASINGQLSRYMTVELDGKTQPIYYDDSSNINTVLYDFNEQMLKGEKTKTFKYVMVPGYGENGNYLSVKRHFPVDANGNPTEFVIAVVQRGSNTFEEKVGVAMRNGASAIIVYNNVAGTIRMNLGDMDDPIPSASVSLDAGNALLKAAGSDRVGEITLNDDNQEGPFMNDYSSWGSTPDLKLKPDVTAHGGEITSTVAGGYDEMSGTSMATPNLAGFAALLTSYIKKNPEIACSPDKYTELTNQIIMSTATTVYDREGLPYSPRKQGSGLATLDNVFGTKAYLYCEDEENCNRPKIELGEDELKKGTNQGKGVYNMSFKVKNFGADSLSFTTQAIFMTETLSSNKLAVAEKAHLFSDKGVWKVNGNPLGENQSFTVNKGEVATIDVTLTLTREEKNYLENNFDNGMFVEGFLKLISSDKSVQCDLTLPFMGFYGDWDKAPMLDMDCYQQAEYEKDTSYDDLTRPQPQIWATQAYAMYYNNKYTVPLGSYVYLQPDDAEEQGIKMYTDADHAAISRYNEFTDEENLANYMTTTGLKALYAGLLRNAELVTYKISNAETGEVIPDENGNEFRNAYRIGKAYSGGGSTRPANIQLEYTPDDLGLTANGKYALEFHFYRTAADRTAEESMTAEERAEYEKTNTFKMTFYVDYDAPVLVSSRIKYRDEKNGNKVVQKAFLELDVYDNHYPQAAMLCYASADGTSASDGGIKIQLATDYITPIANAKKNDTTTVSIEVTDIIKDDKYKNSLYVQLTDYALNYTVYSLSFSDSNNAVIPSGFEIAENSKITTDNRGDKLLTLGLNEAFTVNLNGIGDAKLSNFGWETGNPAVAEVRNGQIFAAGVGETTITIVGNGATKYLNVKVQPAENTIRLNSISFGVIKNDVDALQKATGTVEVNAGQRFKLEVLCEPWYYPVEDLKLSWSCDNTDIATVDQNGNVVTLDKKGRAFIKAVVLNENGTESSYSASVTLSVQEPFTITNSTLTDYHGSGGDIVLPDDENITTIGEDAFKDNDNITSIVIPKTVTEISARAFKNCTALEEVYFIQKEPLAIPDAKLAYIRKQAFEGCTALRLVDLSNVKTITLDKLAFRNCTALEEVRKMVNVGTMNLGAFTNCTSLKVADISGLHNSGAGSLPIDEFFCDVNAEGYVTGIHYEKSGVFSGCTSIDTVITGKYSAISDYMFYGCTSLNSVEINCARLGAHAFEGCSNLASVTLGKTGAGLEFNIGAYAFNKCSKLNAVNFNGNRVVSMGDMAFANCTSLTSFALPNNDVILGDQVFENTNANITADGMQDGAVYNGTTLVLAPKTINAGWAIKSGTTEIAPYAFSTSTLASGVDTIAIPASVTKIGEGAFAYLNLKNITLPALTEISDYMLYGAESLTSVTIPASVTKIGVSAFEGCVALKGVEFADGSVLAEIGDSAFKNCEALESIVLPAGPAVNVSGNTFTGGAKMGSEVFYGCVKLQTVTLPSLTSLGDYTFFGCGSLTTVTFGADSSTTGNYTFYPGNDGYNIYVSALKNVTLGENTLIIGVSAFEACSELESIDLKNAVIAGAASFKACVKLSTVTGMEKLRLIGDEAFRGCIALDSLNLNSAEYVGNLAFSVIKDDGSTSSERYTSVTLPKVKEIGYLAFYGSGASNVALPATLEKIGAGAFATSELNRISIAKNDRFFVDNNVLYRYITPATYELVLYPSTYTTGTFTAIDGTVAIGDYAFSGLVVSPDGSKPVKRVVLPYSVKTIGINAFANSSIEEYEFNSIKAPTLLSEYANLAELYPSLAGRNVNTMYYYNFDSRFIEYTGIVSATPSVLKIIYPENGSGYENFVYYNYFRGREVKAEVIDDETRALKEMIEGFEYSAETVRSWTNLENNAENKKMVEDFAAQVKEAHRLLNELNDRIKNNIVNQKQYELLGEDTVAKLTSVESALRDVKAHFGIKVNATSLKLSSTSTHKTEYKTGEKFDMTGLALIVVYDDYSEELADMSKISLKAEYSGALDSLYRYVEVEGYGVTLRVNVTVSDEVSGGDGDNGGGCSGCGTFGSEGGGFDGGMLILLGAIGILFGVRFIIKRKKHN